MQSTPQSLNDHLMILPCCGAARLTYRTIQHIQHPFALDMLPEMGRLTRHRMTADHADRFVGLRVCKTKSHIGEGNGFQSALGCVMLGKGGFKIVREMAYFFFNQLREEILFISEVEVDRAWRIPDLLCQSSHGQPIDSIVHKQFAGRIQDGGTDVGGVLFAELGFGG